MALQTYSDLKTAIANWADRSDLTSRIPEFITLAEARLVRHKLLRSWETDSTLTGSVGSRSIAVPTGFLTALALWWEDTVGREELRFVLPELMATSTTDGRPEYWTVDGAYIKFERELDSAYSFTLRNRQFAALSDSNTTNALLTKWPDAYLFASMSELFSYLMDDAQVAKWEARYANARDEITTMEAENKSLSTLSVDTALRARPHSFNINTGE